MDTHIQWLAQYGYIGLFTALMLGIVAVPVPEETILTLGGFLVYNGTLRWLPTSIAGFLGSACGITVSYALGRTLGFSAIRRFGHFIHVNVQKLEKVCWWFRRTGKWLLPLAYFIPGVRHLAALVAGASRLELRIFALFAYVGALVWSQTFIAVGYFFGPHWKTVIDSMARHRLVAIAFIVVALLSGFAIRRRDS